MCVCFFFFWGGGGGGWGGGGGGGSVFMIHETQVIFIQEQDQNILKDKKKAYSV